METTTWGASPIWNLKTYLEDFLIVKASPDSLVCACFPTSESVASFLSYAATFNESDLTLSRNVNVAWVIDLVSCSLLVPDYDQHPRKISWFYDQLDQIIRAIPNANKKSSSSEFKARVDKTHTWPKVLSKFETGNANTNLLLSICTEHQLVITDIYLRHKQTHPRCKHWHHIHITRLRDQPELLNTRAMRGANFCTDHVMIKSSTKLREKRRIRRNSQPTRSKSIVKDDLQASLKDRQAEIPAGTVRKWNSFKSILYRVSK